MGTVCAFGVWHPVGASTQISGIQRNRPCPAFSDKDLDLFQSLSGLWLRPKLRDLFLPKAEVFVHRRPKFRSGGYCTVLESLSVPSGRASTGPYHGYRKAERRTKQPVVLLHTEEAMTPNQPSRSCLLSLPCVVSIFEATLELRVL